MGLKRRRFVTATAGALAAGAFAGCTGSEGNEEGTRNGTSAAASFFVFGEVTAAVAGDTADVDLLVPTGQHGHGWEPGPRVREAVGDADLFVHGMEGFQPWVDSVRTDLEADGEGVRPLDVSESVDLLEAGGEHGGQHHTEGEHHDGHTETTEHEEEHDHGPVDPHFWMDPLRVKTATRTVRQGLTEIDGAGADSYEANAAASEDRLDDLDAEISSAVDAATKGTLLVAGHDSFQYLAERYGLRVEALTNVSPDDRPTARDIEHAQGVIAEHDLQYVCADPLESQQAAAALVEETDAEAVLPLTAMPGLTDEWAENDWGYVDVMTEVNLPTLEQALGA